MVAYAVGEMSRQVPVARDSEDAISENHHQPIAASSSSSITRSISRGQSSMVLRHGRWQKPPASCYEVVTAWVHPG